MRRLSFMSIPFLAHQMLPVLASFFVSHMMRQKAQPRLPRFRINPPLFEITLFQVRGTKGRIVHCPYLLTRYEASFVTSAG